MLHQKCTVIKKNEITITKDQTVEKKAVASRRIIKVNRRKQKKKKNNENIKAYA